MSASLSVCPLGVKFEKAALTKRFKFGQPKFSRLAKCFLPA